MRTRGPILKTSRRKAATLARRTMPHSSFTESAAVRIEKQKAPRTITAQDAATRLKLRHGFTLGSDGRWT